MDNDEVLDAETLEGALEKVSAEYEAISDIDKVDEENLAALIAEELKLMEAVRANRSRQQEIKDKRYSRRADLNRAQRAKDEAQMKYDEANRFRLLEEKRAQAFKDMVAYAKEQKFQWLDFAHPHQWEGAMTIAHYGSAILGDGTGLGKTITYIMSLDLKKSKKNLIVVPNDIVSDFADAIRIWAPHRNVIPIAGATPHMRKMIRTVVESSAEFTVVTNYESLWKDFTWLQENVDWDDIGIDEAHNMKNEKGLTFDALDQFRYKNCVPITATSILNSPQDLYTSLHMIAPNQFYDRFSYLRNYCTQNAEGKWIFRPGGEKALMRSMQGRFIKRTYEEAGIVIPKQTVNEVVIPKSAVPEKQATIQDQIKNYNAIALDTGESVEINAIIAAITRERQAAVFPAGIEIKVTEKMYELNPNMGPVGTVLLKVPDDVPSIKLDMAEDKLDRVIKSGKRCVVFSQFKTALVDLEARLTKRGIKVVRYDGDTNKATRLSVKRDFLRPADGEHKADYKYDVVLANYKTGGVGLTFTEATYMLCLDEEWNPAKNAQAWARIHRIGQTEETTVDILRIEGSIDMWMKTLNEIKQAIVNGFEQEIDVLASLKEYFAKPAVESEQKAIESHVVEEIVDQDFLDMLEGL